MIIITYRWSSVAVVMSGTASRYLWRLFNLLVKQIVVVGVVVVPVLCPQCRTSSPTRDRNAPCAMPRCQWGGCGCGCRQSSQHLLEPSVKLFVEGFLEPI